VPESKQGESDFERFQSRYSSSASSSDESESTFYNNVTNFLSKAFDTTKNITVTVKDKVVDMNIPSKLMYTGSTIYSTGKSIYVILFLIF